MSKLFGTVRSSRVDSREVTALFKNVKLTEQDLLDIEKPGGLNVANTQKTLVPVDTAATKTSISQHIQSSSDTEVIDHIGPETDYAEFIEFGVISKPNYPIQPFVRPSAMGASADKVFNVIEFAFRKKVEEKSG